MNIKRKVTLNGVKGTISGPGLENTDLVVLEIMHEMCIEQGTNRIKFTEQEMAKRLIQKGYDPETGKPLH